MVEQKGENQACFRRRNQLSEGRSKRWEEWECWGREQAETQNQTKKVTYLLHWSRSQAFSAAHSPQRLSHVYYHVYLLFIHRSIVVTISISHSITSDTLATPRTVRSPSGPSVHGILQARILEWVAISFSRGSSRPKNQTQVSCTEGRFFTIWAIEKTPINQYLLKINYLALF